MKSVSRTRIFARHLDGGMQVLVYSMSFQAGAQLAMILPLPVPAGSPEEAVRFISLEGYDAFFDDMKKAFPVPVPRGVPQGIPAAAPASIPKELLVVHEVGDFESSFVPTLDDFGRLDPRFALSPDVWSKLPQYGDWGFAVFKLKGEIGKEKDVHPMAFAFPRRDPDTLFFPTVHVHDGEVHEMARFDHTLYCQPVPAAAAGWRESAGPLGRFVNADDARSVIDPDAPGYVLDVRGFEPNVDLTYAVG